MAKLCIMRSTWTFCPWLVRSQISARCQFPLALQSLMAFWTKLDVIALAMWWTIVQIASSVDPTSAPEGNSKLTWTAKMCQFQSEPHDSDGTCHELILLSQASRSESHSCLDCLQQRSNISTWKTTKAHVLRLKRHSYSGGQQRFCGLRSVPGSLWSIRNLCKFTVYLHFPTFTIQQRSLRHQWINQQAFWPPCCAFMPVRSLCSTSLSPSGPQTWFHGIASNRFQLVSWTDLQTVQTSYTLPHGL